MKDPEKKSFFQALAKRLEPGGVSATIPADQITILRDFAAKAQNSLAKSSAGLIAVFSGSDDSSKFAAASFLANELRLPLFRIDLAAVVSKFIGETEKNLEAIFSDAEAGGAIHLFDEADALFGKRSEVKDAHDRYANVEVDYLLQRIEQFQGIVILATNGTPSMPPDWQHRVHATLHFPPNL